MGFPVIVIIVMFIMECGKLMLLRFGKLDMLKDFSFLNPGSHTPVILFNVNSCY
jgi:hypothetical protein